MTDQAADTGLQLFSTATDDNRLELSLRRVPVPTPGAEEVVVRIEATPLNPSDLGLLLSAADPASFAVTASGDQPVTTGTIPAALARVVAARKGKSLPVGNEAAGTVVKAGGSAQALLGKTVAIVGGAMYTQYRLLKARDCLVLPEGTTAEQGASSFVNPMTALSMVSVLRRAGEKALVHTAAASNLGQMLVKLCQADGIPLVNIVRRPEQAEILRAQGAEHIVDSSSPTFLDDLTQAAVIDGWFFTGDIGMPPTRSYQDGQRGPADIWAFPVLNFGRVASFEEARGQDVPEDQLGAWLTDVDGRQLLDLSMGFGAMLVGHLNPVVVAKVTEAFEALKPMPVLNAQLRAGVPASRRHRRRNEAFSASRRRSSLLLKRVLLE